MNPTHPKLTEAAFFIELFEATQERKESLTYNGSREEEASFIFSAILNAFYSALDQWRSVTKKDTQYKHFVNNYPEIYSHSHYGGWRSTTVHVRHISISHTVYAPQKNGKVNLNFQVSPKLAEANTSENQVNLNFSPRYSVEYRGELHEVAAFSRFHLRELTELMQ
jgi:hypothetical protein